MHRTSPLLLAVLLVSCRGDRPAARRDSASPAPVAAARACGDSVLSGDGVGSLRIGADVDSVKARCTAAHDTVAPDLEGHPARTVEVLAGGDTVLAEIVDGRVWRLQVTRASPRTADGLGVGTRLGRLLELPGVRGNVGEGALFVTATSHCGLSFQLSDDGMRSGTTDWTAAALRRLPEATVVTRVLAFGCRAADARD